MGIPFLNAIDLGKNELKGLRIENLSAAPSSPVLGQLYYNTTAKRLYVCINTATPIWEEIAASSASLAPDITQLSCAIRRTTTQSIGVSSWTVMDLTTRLWGPSSMHNTGTGFGEIIIPVTGLYDIVGHLRFTAGGTQQSVQITQYDSAGAYVAGLAEADSGNLKVSVSSQFELTANDRIRLRAFQNGSATTVMATNYISPELRVTYKGKVAS